MLVFLLPTPMPMPTPTPRACKFAQKHAAVGSQYGTFCHRQLLSGKMQARKCSKQVAWGKPVPKKPLLRSPRSLCCRYPTVSSNSWAVMFQHQGSTFLSQGTCAAAKGATCHMPATQPDGAMLICEWEAQQMPPNSSFLHVEGARSSGRCSVSRSAGSCTSAALGRGRGADSVRGLVQVGFEGACECAYMHECAQLHRASCGHLYVPECGKCLALDKHLAGIMLTETQREPDIEL